MDVERVVAKRLMDATGVKAVLEVPPTRPDEFLSVELTGSTDSRFLQRVTLAVQSWAKTRKRAREIASMVQTAVFDLVDEPDVFEATPTSTYRWPDPDSRQERYQTVVEMIICE